MMIRFNKQWAVGSALAAMACDMCPLRRRARLST